MDNIKVFADALSSVVTDDIFGGIVTVFDNIVDAFELLLSSTDEAEAGSSK
ncbi:MAG: hypothetical protein Q4G50_12520 [Corynebacterium sp.]|uniref:hypothetical protein n=1 Tax=Corynebacterium sp. TaxID=1720 RepID=UPI0026DEF198|nr:hypothetical protein [Corynebacterium sp.]MDO5670810.1 hypothetical protein [Corynebacterium sp.]